MKKVAYLLIIIVGTLYTSCEKDSQEITGNVIFCTNAQAMLNCGSFDVNVYIDETFAGKIKEPITTLEGVPDCTIQSNETFLVVNNPDGDYTFSARITCSGDFWYTGEFKVKQDSCSLVYIDLNLAN